MKYVDVTIDKPRKLRFNSNALTRLEKEIEKPLGEVLKPFIEASKGDGFAAVDISTMRALLWAGLLHEDPTLTIEQAGDLMDEAQEAENDDVFEKVFEAVSKSGFFMQMTRKGLKDGSSETSNDSTTPE